MQVEGFLMAVINTVGITVLAVQVLREVLPLKGQKSLLRMHIFDDQEHEFYDLHEDPHELVNLAMDRNRRAEIREWYERLREAETEEFVSLQANVINPPAFSSLD